MSEYWKSILAFISLVVTNIAVTLTQTSAPWPGDVKGWVVFAVTTLLGTWLVYQKSNAPAGKHALAE